MYSPQRTFNQSLSSKGFLNKGFSLLELIVVILIVAILVGTAIPSFTQSIQNNRLVTEVNELITGINKARHAAIAEGTEAVICHSAAPNAASPICGGTGSSWKTGYLVYVKNKDSVTTNDDAGLNYNSSNDELLSQIIGSNEATHSVTPTNPNSAKHIAFNSIGLVLNGPNHVLDICDERDGDHGSTITISAAGRIGRAKLTCMAPL